MDRKVCTLLIVWGCILNVIQGQQKVVYTFTEFPYKESAKNVKQTY